MGVSALSFWGCLHKGIVMSLGGEGARAPAGAGGVGTLTLKAAGVRPGKMQDEPAGSRPRSAERALAGGDPGVHIVLQAGAVKWLSFEGREASTWCGGGRGLRDGLGAVSVAAPLVP